MTKLKKLGFGVSGIATTPDNDILHTHNFYPDLAIVDINLNASKTGKKRRVSPTIVSKNLKNI